MTVDYNEELQYIKIARTEAAEYVNDSLTLDRHAGYISGEDFKIVRCLWTTKDWNVTFSSEKIPGDLVYVSYFGKDDTIEIEMVRSEYGETEEAA